MRLDSVRELKLDLLEQAVSAAAAAGGLQGAASSVLAGATALALASRAAQLTATRRVPVVLGVSKRGKRQYALAVRVQKRAVQLSPVIDRIRRAAKNEVDLRYVGAIEKRTSPWHRSRQRPFGIGCSIGHHRVTAGTVGAFVEKREGGPLEILSNNHVLANENRAKPGDVILQPGSLDSGSRPRDEVASLSRFVRLRKGSANVVDGAVAEVLDSVAVDRARLRGLGKLRGVASEIAGDETPVLKLGRTTGRTRGRISAFELDNVSVEFDIGVLSFDGQIEIEGEGERPFSDGGDSGSLIFDSDRYAIGLLFAGSDQGGENGQGLTYANPIGTVLEQLGVELSIA